MNVDQCAEFFGSQTKMAAAIGTHPATISGWRKRGIPLSAQWQIELVAKDRGNNELVADERPELSKEIQAALRERFRKG